MGPPQKRVRRRELLPDHLGGRENEDLVTSMSLLRKVRLGALRNLRPKASHESESFWSQGKQEKVPGYLFNETPPPPGESRKWESWEPGWYDTYSSVNPLNRLAFAPSGLLNVFTSDRTGGAIR